MLLESASIGRKLLLSFASMAGLLILAVGIGTSGFSFVANTEEKVADSFIPAMIQAREVSEQSSRILASLRELSNAQTEQERQASGKLLFAQLKSLLIKIKQLGDTPFDSTILDTLEIKVQNVIDTIVELGVIVEEKLFLRQHINLRVEEMRQLAVELETLTRTQVLNTSTIAVANITHIYDLIEKTKKQQAYQALDNLIEVDMDLTERLHELHLLAFQVLAHIEEAKTVTDYRRIQQLTTEFDSNLDIIKRRIQSVEDPTRSQQMKELLSQMEVRKEVFDYISQRYENAQQVEEIKSRALTQFSELNKTVNQLVDESNADTAQAVTELGQTLNYAKWSLVVLSLLGLMAVSFILWNVVYLSVVRKLHDYSDAIRAVARGELEFELDIEGNDELAKMGKAIVTARDTAAKLQVVAKSEAEAKQDLEEHKEHLEETVTERTKQLRLTNEKLNQEVAKHAQAREEAEEANKAKTVFLSTMSHEIRTPMNGVLGTATLLNSTSLSPQQSQYVDVINRSGNALLAILNDVLDYSKIEAGHLEIRHEPFNLKDLVDDVYHLQKSRALEKGLGFNQHIESNVAGYWSGDATRITQLLNNLIGNAIKFTSRGDVDIYAGLDPQTEGNILFEVSDTGVGISEEDQSKLFDAFTQLGAAQGKIGGTGLGLAISRKIVSAMKGQIGVESIEGEGSRFSFSIPLDEAETPEVMPLRQEEDTKLRAKILLVEDNPVNCLVAEGFLTHHGHEVFIAEDGAQARALFAKEEFDIGLLDINLPDCNGVDLLHELRAMEEGRECDDRTPMVAISAHVFNEEVREYLNSGFDGYLPKPINKEKLLNLVQLNLQGRDLTLAQGEDESEPGDSGVVDIRVLSDDKEVLGNEKVKQLVDLFETSSNESLQILFDAAADSDSALVKQTAHKLKGSAGSMGMTALHALCLEIESDPDPLECYRKREDRLRKVVELSTHLIRKGLGI